MIVTIEMGPEFDRVIASMSSMGAAVLEGCSVGLGKGVKIAAGNVVRNYLSGQSLKRRSRNLANAVDGWLEGKLDGVVGVKENSAVDRYKWLLGDEQKTIVPKKGKFLSIPIGENLTGTGVARYSSPRQVEDGFFLRTKRGSLLFGRKNGTRGKFRPLFAMVTSVFIQGTGALYDGTMESTDDIADAMSAEIDKKI